MRSNCLNHGHHALVVACLACLLNLVTSPDQAVAQESLRTRRNFIGVHNLKDGGPQFQIGMDWTSHLSGSTGFVSDWVADIVPWIESAFQRNLIPCIRVQECNGGCTPSAGYAGKVASTVCNYKLSHPQDADRLVYLQLWNEPGEPRDFVPVPVYADYLVAAHNLIEQVEASSRPTRPAPTPASTKTSTWITRM